LVSRTALRRANPSACRGNASARRRGTWLA
jgi:hypothetical protein